MAVKFLHLLLLIGALTAGEGDWADKCRNYLCNCVWSSGRKLADCTKSHLNEVPKDLSTELRDIDFSNNPFYELSPRVFSLAGLQNIHKLKLQNCSLQQIHELAFESLRLLIELDLSNNAIKTLDKYIFKDNTKLRILSLANNRIKMIEDRTFSNMQQLQKIDLNNNELQTFDTEVFDDDCTLLHLHVENNKLTTISANFRDKLKKIGSFGLSGNPWICDCNLQAFRAAALESNWITNPVECNSPERLKGRKWSDTFAIFACDPKIIEPSPNAVFETDSINTTIPCKVSGDPRPSVVWFTNGRAVDTQRNSHKYVITSSKDIPYWDNLTIINTSYRDKGEYKCVATNAGGSDERNITLYTRGSDYIGGGTLSSSSMSQMMIWIIVLAVGCVALLILIIFLIICCCKKNSRNRNIMSKNRPMGQSNEFISLDGRPEEIEKSLLTDVNPVSKPPRQYSVPPSVTSGGTEVSETKKMLMDEDSYYTGDEESRSYDFSRNQQPKSQNQLDVDYRSEHHYPPDLLSFPPRGTCQISPAGSSASTVADTTRLPPHHGPQSPLHSPLYESANLYRTLPYSRSHSPFTSPHGVPIRVPRQGAYVTIPRRPRASWSSEPPNMSDICEPLYDNLGLRTTATGASALSLNKLNTEPTTPRGMRPMFPLSPQTCDPIAEHESPPTATTLPRTQRAISSNSNLDAIRASWAKSPNPDSRRESTASLLPSSETKTPKVPPRPPPKPKKKTSTGPLFEDEGEDGTEV